MCGILAVSSHQASAKSLGHYLARARAQSLLLKHRGPDETGVVQTLEGAILCHERLSIVDVKSGHQPIKGRGDVYVIHNGEIYNHEALWRDTLTFKGERKTKSDSEIIVRLYEERGEGCVHFLDGVYAFVIADGARMFAARDPLGVKPLFFGHDKEGVIWFASEMKALISVCEDITEFPPGHYYTSEQGFVRFFSPGWFKGSKATQGPELLREALTKAVKKRLMSDVPLGVLLSGGLDSSLISSIVAREMKKIGKSVKSFSVGLTPQSQDLVKAREVAKFLGTEHHEILFTVEQGIALLPELISKVESYDVTTIRASTPMYIMSKYIHDQGVKVVLSGEGADELFGGYLYFHNAPSDEEFHSECLRRVKRLHTSDVLRCDRATMGAALEARVPFLDQEFLRVAMELDPKLKRSSKDKIEKEVLRKAFDDTEEPYLPDSILWRQKEQFSDGVGYSWIDGLKAYAEATISDDEFSKSAELFPYQTPETKEAFLYRKIFAAAFPHADAPMQIKRWVPRWQKNKDPSGRANTVHESAYEPGPDGKNIRPLEIVS